MWLMSQRVCSPAADLVETLSNVMLLHCTCCCRCCTSILLHVYPFLDFIYILSGGCSTSAARAAPISPGGLKAAMGRRSYRWAGNRQEDAHEFLTELLDAVQSEVLTAEVASSSTAAPNQVTNRCSVRVSETACPASRTFTGCLKHEMVCQQCQHRAMVGMTQARSQFLYVWLPMTVAIPCACSMKVRNDLLE